MRHHMVRPFVYMSLFSYLSPPFSSVSFTFSLPPRTDSTASNATRNLSGGTEYGVAFQVDDQSTDPFARITLENYTVLEDYTAKTPYQVLPATAPSARTQRHPRKGIREGAQRMLQRALDAEVQEFLDRDRYVRTADFRGIGKGPPA